MGTTRIAKEKTNMFVKIFENSNEETISAWLEGQNSIDIKFVVESSTGTTTLNTNTVSHKVRTSIYYEIAADKTNRRSSENNEE